MSTEERYGITAKESTAPRVGVERIVSILDNTVIIEDENGWCMKIQPTGSDSFNIFKQYSMGWDYNDNVCLDTAVSYIRDCKNLYSYKEC